MEGTRDDETGGFETRGELYQHDEIEPPPTSAPLPDASRSSSRRIWAAVLAILVLGLLAYLLLTLL